MKVYKVQVHGVVEVHATNADEAKTNALAYFALSPTSYLSVLEEKEVILTIS